jgi:hypothetical protein
VCSAGSLAGTSPPAGRQQVGNLREGPPCHRLARAAVPQSIAVALALIDYSDQWLQELGWPWSQRRSSMMPIPCPCSRLCHDPPSRARVCHACYRALPTGPGLRVLLPARHMRQGICGQAGGDLRHEERPGLAHVGLVRSGRPVPPAPASGPTVSGPLSDQARAGQGLDHGGASAGPSRL